MRNKIIIVVITLLFLSVVSILGYTFSSLESLCVDYFYMSDDFHLEKDYDGKACLINITTGEKDYRYDDVLPHYVQDDAKTFVTIKDGKRGYISSETGDVIFEPQFKYAWLDNGCNNIAACVNMEDKMGFVNIQTKECVIPFQYEFDEDVFCPYDYYWGKQVPKFDFVFSNGLCIVPGANGAIGLINEAGEIVIPIEYDDIINWRDADCTKIILKKQLIDDYEYSVYDKTTNDITPLEYDSVTIIDDYLYYLPDDKVRYIVSIGGLYGIVDNSLNTILPVEYDDIYIEDLPEFDESLVLTIKDYVPQLHDLNGYLLSDFYVRSYETYDEELYEYVETTDFTAIPEPYTNEASEYIMYAIDDAYGVIDGSKRIVLPAKYDSVEYLGNGNFVCVVNGITNIFHDNK